MSRSLAAVTIVALVGSGVVAGIFFAFSSFVMQALDRLPPDESIRAMQSINVVAVTPPFMTALFGTALVCAGLAVAALLRLDEPGAVHHLVAGPTYLITIVLTGVYHVPRNDALAAVDPTAADASAHWSRYFTEWTVANHVRAISPIVAAVLYALALRSA